MNLEPIGRQRARRIGSAIIGFGGTVALSAFLWFAWQAWRSNGDRFGQVAAWASIVGVALVGIGFIVRQLRSVAIQYPRPAAGELDHAQTELAAIVLSEEAENRARLLGTDSIDTGQINVAFYRQLIQFRTAYSNHTGDLETIQGYYASMRPGRLVVTGAPGAGKTVLAVHLLVCLLEAQQAQGIDISGPTPIRFSLSEFATDQPLEIWLARQLATRYPLRLADALALVRRGRILPVLDGLDEMDSESSSRARAGAAIDRMNSYVQGSNRGRLVVTCRRLTYDELASPIEESTVVEIQPLVASQVSSYIESQVRTEGERTAWSPVVDVLEDDPSGVTASSLLFTLPTPWLLNLAVTASRDPRRPFDPRDLLAGNTGPVALVAHAEQIRLRLLAKYIPAKAHLNPHKGQSCHDGQQVIEWLRNVAELLAWQGSRGLSSADLFLYRLFPMAGFKRVVTAQVVLNLVLLWGALLFATWLGDVEWSWRGAGWVAALLPGIAMKGLKPWPLPSAGADLGRLRGDRLRRLLGAMPLAQIAAAGLLLVTTMSLAYVAIVFIAPLPGPQPLESLANWLASCLGASVGGTLGLLVSLESKPSSSTFKNIGLGSTFLNPRVPIRSDGIHGFTYALVFGVLCCGAGVIVTSIWSGALARFPASAVAMGLLSLMAGTAVALALGPILRPGGVLLARLWAHKATVRQIVRSLMLLLALGSGRKRYLVQTLPLYGAFGAYLFGMVTGFVYWRSGVFPSVLAAVACITALSAVFTTVFTRYMVAQAFLVASRRMPPRIGSFFDWACAAGLMRVSGDAYQIRHRELQEWLLTDSSAPPPQLPR